MSSLESFLLIARTSSDCHCHRIRGEYRRIHRVFQHLARFVTELQWSIL